MWLTLSIDFRRHHEIRARFGALDGRYSFSDLSMSTACMFAFDLGFGTIRKKFRTPRNSCCGGFVVYFFFKSIGFPGFKHFADGTGTNIAATPVLVEFKSATIITTTNLV